MTRMQIFKFVMGALLHLHLISMISNIETVHLGPGGIDITMTAHR